MKIDPLSMQTSQKRKKVIHSDTEDKKIKKLKPILINAIIMVRVRVRAIAFEKYSDRVIFCDDINHW